MSVDIEKGNFSPNITENTHRDIPLKLYEPALISTTCSCVECDSNGCFETRFNKDGLQCSCQQCQYSDNCLFYPFKKILSAKNNKGKRPDVKNLTKPKNEVIKEVIKEHTDKQISWTKVSKSDVNKEYKFKYKSFSQTKNKIETKRNEYYEKDVTKVHSVTVNYSRKDHHNSAAQLSAQVMDVPYQEFRHSVSFNESRRKSSPVSVIAQQKRDIFSRIKEIYKACSCKVCECIAGKSLMPRNDTCRCEPCDCKDCSNIAEKLKQSSETQDSRDYSSYIRCSSNNCNAVTRDGEIFQSCDCKPCDCVKCVENFTKPCDCEPCQCVECGFPVTGSMIRRTVVVAPVEGNIQHNVCQCEPCECLNCTHNYGAMSSSLMRETSTGASMHRNCQCETCISEACQLDGTSCRCDINKKIMKKPMEKDIRDYDIHEALIINKSPFIRTRSQTDRHKNIDIITSPSNNYSAMVFNKNQCKCLDCECIICKDKEKHKDKENSKTIYQSFKHQDKMHEINILSSKACKCLPCECQVCMVDKPSEIDVKYSDKSVRNCKCDVCDCIDCYNLSYCLNNTINQSQIHSKPIKCYSIQDKCLCNPCECTECKTLRDEEKFCNKNSIDVLHENLYPLKKGKLLTPSMFEANIIGLSNKSNQEHIIKSEEKIVKKKYSPESIHFPQKSLIYNRTFPYNFSHAALKKSVSFKEKPDSLSIDNQESPSKGIKNEPYAKNCKNKYNCDVFHAEINVIKSKPSLKTEVLASRTDKKNRKEQNLCQKSKSSSVCQTSKCKSFRHCTTGNENSVKEKGSLNIIYDNNLTINSHSHLKKSSIILSATSHKPAKHYNDINLTSEVSENVRIADTIKRVKKTLENAEAYTKNLMKILEKSEKDNNDFVSSTQKYKNLETSDLDSCLNDFDHVQNSDMVLKDNYIATKYSTKSDNYKSSPDKSLNAINFVSRSKDIESFTPQNESLYYDKVNSDRELTQNNDDIMLNCDIERKDSALKLIKNTQEPELFKHLNRNGSKASGSSTGTKTYGGIYYRDKVIEVPLEQSDLKISNNIESKQLVEAENKPDFNHVTVINKFNYNKKWYEKPYRELQKNRDSHVGFNIGEKNLYLNSKPMKSAKGLTYHVIENDVKATVQHISDQLKDYSCKDNGLFANYSEIIVLKKLQKGVSDLLNSCILRTAQSANDKTELAETRQRQAKTKLDLELKYTCNDAASQTFPNKLKVEKEVNCNRVISKEELYSKMESYLDIIVSRAVYKSELTSPKQKRTDIRRRKPRVDIIKSSCESLKARFDVVKRVSDHTVLVRWNVPQALKDVEGYELQVDGRAVKKIFGPSKCMAVVTCLPHSDRVLLTIRTITSSQLPFGRQPATTIIYRPRNK